MRATRKEPDEQADDQANGAAVPAGQSTKPPESKPVVVQEYLRPYLLGGHKFDFRLYVVVAGVNPMQAYICRTGMVRRCMTKYQQPTTANANEKLIHRTSPRPSLEAVTWRDVRLHPQRLPSSSRARCPVCTRGASRAETGWVALQ
jgi:hypothetical protein